MTVCANGLVHAETAFSLEGTVWEQAAEKFGLQKELLYAIALAESKKKADSTSMRPWPWALNIQGVGHFYDSRAEAEAALQRALASGLRSIDVGPMQVNLLWHGYRVDRPEDLFDVETAAMVGAEILSEAMLSSPRDEVIGVGRYHNWEEGVSRVYGTKVLQFRNAVVQATEGRY